MSWFDRLCDYAGAPKKPPRYPLVSEVTLKRPDGTDHTEQFDPPIPFPRAMVRAHEKQ